ncbi:MAG TPA: hypothetical protein VI199_13050, partial [Novosphingobium sp.]
RGRIGEGAGDHAGHGGRMARLEAGAKEYAPTLPARRPGLDPGPGYLASGRSKLDPGSGPG